MHDDAFRQARRPGAPGVPGAVRAAGCLAALFAIGTVAAALHGRLPATGVLIACAVIVAVASFSSEVLAAIPLGIIGWLTAAGFSRPPYADLRPADAAAGRAAVVLAVTAATAAALGLGFRHWSARFTREVVEDRGRHGISVRRRLAGAGLAAANRQAHAARSGRQTASLLGLAQTVLGGADTPADVLDHLTSAHGGHAELLERSGGRWIMVAASGDADPAGPATRFEVRPDLALEVRGQRASATTSLLVGYTSQAVAALDRARLRTQAAQAEALEEGNRMRTALLAAVSHDLRTPLAAIKASVSSLRQTDVAWTASDKADLLATVEQNTGRLDSMIRNLLDMSRLQAGSLAPFLRATAVDEVAQLASRGLDLAERLMIAVPEGLPLVKADPGLLERVLANLFSNALRYSPPDSPPALLAREAPGAGPRPGSPGQVIIEVIDHGPGVPADQRERIFEPFQRLADSRPGAPRAGGSSGIGLGLSVAKGFTEAMGGTIEAASTPGGGLTVRVTLLAEASAVTARLSPA